MLLHPAPRSLSTRHAGHRGLRFVTHTHAIALLVARRSVGGPVPDLQCGEALGGLKGWTPEPDICPKKSFKWVDGP